MPERERLVRTCRLSEAKNGAHLITLNLNRSAAFPFAAIARTGGRAVRAPTIK